VGGVFRDVYSLPLAGVPSGEYTLEVGLYDPASGERLPVGNSDSYTVQSVTIAQNP